MSTNGKILNKIAVCCCCSQMAYSSAQCFDLWASAEAYGLCYLNCQSCCWTLFAPVCHTCKLGDTNDATAKCKTAMKYWALSCGLSCVAPLDGCINCVLYARDNCKDGVSGFSDVTKNFNFLGAKIKAALQLETGNEPGKTYGTFNP